MSRFAAFAVLLLAVACVASASHTYQLTVTGYGPALNLACAPATSLPRAINLKPRLTTSFNGVNVQLKEVSGPTFGFSPIGK